ncbi:MAG TPA: zf-HC2 domain-containing protein [Vicinamibacterales bacterium]|nr:zf-HC2 domain-containing protein [Vicinamibacterales bacterium]
MQGESRPCIDAETLAAWADGGLRPAEAAAVEQHLSDCDRCTAMLATFVRTTPAAPAAESLWHRWRLTWLVPVATAATAVALWVAIPRNPTPAASEPAQTARQENARQANTVPAREEAPASTTLSEQAKDKKEVATPPAPSIGGLARREEFARPQSKIARADEAETRSRELAEPLQVREAPDKTLEADQRTADLQANRGAATAPAAPPAAAASAAATAPSERTQQTFAAGRQAAALAANLTEIVSPNPANRWRIVAGGRIERSTNGGMQWEPVSLPSTATLTAGSSPAATICWIVGRAGVVYLTTDGVRFTRVPFPESIDLASVQPTDDRHATVRAIDGRTFRTDDQGTTWTRGTP